MSELEKNLENFDLKRLPLRIRHQTKILLDGSFVDRKGNLLAFGNPAPYRGVPKALCQVKTVFKEVTVKITVVEGKL